MPNDGATGEGGMVRGLGLGLELRSVAPLNVAEEVLCWRALACMSFFGREARGLSKRERTNCSTWKASVVLEAQSCRWRDAQQRSALVPRVWHSMTVREALVRSCSFPGSGLLHRSTCGVSSWSWVTTVTASSSYEVGAPVAAANFGGGWGYGQRPHS